MILAEYKNYNQPEYPKKVRFWLSLMLMIQSVWIFLIEVANCNLKNKASNILNISNLYISLGEKFPEFIF